MANWAVAKTLKMTICAGSQRSTCRVYDEKGEERVSQSLERNTVGTRLKGLYARRFSSRPFGWGEGNGVSCCRLDMASRKRTMEAQR